MWRLTAVRKLEGVRSKLSIGQKLTRFQKVFGTVLISTCKSKFLTEARVFSQWDPFISKTNHFLTYLKKNVVIIFFQLVKLTNRTEKRHTSLLKHLTLNEKKRSLLQFLCVFYLHYPSFHESKDISSAKKSNAANILWYPHWGLPWEAKSFWTSLMLKLIFQQTTWLKSLTYGSIVRFPIAVSCAIRESSVLAHVIECWIP